MTKDMKKRLATLQKNKTSRKKDNQIRIKKISRNKHFSHQNFKNSTYFFKYKIRHS